MSSQQEDKDKDKVCKVKNCTKPSLIYQGEYLGYCKEHFQEFTRMVLKDFMDKKRYRKDIVSGRRRKGRK